MMMNEILFFFPFSSLLISIPFFKQAWAWRNMTSPTSDDCPSPSTINFHRSRRRNKCIHSSAPPDGNSKILQFRHISTRRACISLTYSMEREEIKICFVWGVGHLVRGLVDECLRTLFYFRWKTIRTLKKYQNYCFQFSLKISIANPSAPSLLIPEDKKDKHKFSNLIQLSMLDYARIHQYPDWIALRQQAAFLSSRNWIKTLKISLLIKITITLNSSLSISLLLPRLLIAKTKKKSRKNLNENW